MHNENKQTVTFIYSPCACVRTHSGIPSSRQRRCYAVLPYDVHTQKHWIVVCSSHSYGWIQQRKIHTGRNMRSQRRIHSVFGDTLTISEAATTQRYNVKCNYFIFIISIWQVCELWNVINLYDSVDPRAYPYTHTSKRVSQFCTEQCVYIVRTSNFIKRQRTHNKCKIWALLSCDQFSSGFNYNFETIKLSFHVKR